MDYIAHCKSQNFCGRKFFTFYILVVFLFSPPGNAGKFFTVYNYNLELTHMKFYDCGVLEGTASFTSEELAIWHF